MKEVGPVIMPGDIVVSATLDRGIVEARTPVVLNGKGSGRRSTDAFAMLAFILARAGVHSVDTPVTIHDVDPVFSNADLDPGILQFVNIWVGDGLGRLEIVDWRPHMGSGTSSSGECQQEERGDPGD